MPAGAQPLAETSRRVPVRLLTTRSPAPDKRCAGTEPGNPTQTRLLLFLLYGEDKTLGWPSADIRDQLLCGPKIRGEEKRPECSFRRGVG